MRSAWSRAACACRRTTRRRRRCALRARRRATARARPAALARRRRGRAPRARPRAAQRSRGALFCAREAHVRSALLTRAFAAAAAARGARLETGRRGARPAARGRARVRRGDARRATGRPASSCSARAASPRRAPRGSAPARASPSSRCADSSWRSSPPGVAPRSIVWGPGAYLVPKRDGSLVVGATVERVGFDARTTAGGVASLLAAARALLPETRGRALPRRLGRAPPRHARSPAARRPVARRAGPRPRHRALPQRRAARAAHRPARGRRRARQGLGRAGVRSGPLREVTEVEGRRVQQLGEDLERIDEARARPVEELRSRRRGRRARSAPRRARASRAGRRAAPARAACARAGSRTAPPRSRRGRRRAARSTRASASASPARASTGSPPAIAISSGSQWPATISGSSHSIIATRGRERAPAGALAERDRRARRAARGARAPRPRGRAPRPRRVTDSHTSPSVRGATDSTRGAPPHGRAERALDVGQAHRAGAALVLREDQLGRERAEASPRPPLNGESASRSRRRTSASISRLGAAAAPEALAT